MRVAANLTSLFHTGPVNPGVRVVIRARASPARYRAVTRRDLWHSDIRLLGPPHPRLRRVTSAFYDQITTLSSADLMEMFRWVLGAVNLSETFTTRSYLRCGGADPCENLRPTLRPTNWNGNLLWLNKVNLLLRHGRRFLTRRIRSNSSPSNNRSADWISNLKIWNIIIFHLRFT